MKVKMNLEGTTRKAMAKTISEITGEAAVYKFTPTYAFEIGDITVSRYGEITCPDDSNIIERLKEKGFQPESEPATEQDVVYTDTDPYTDGDAGQPDQLSIELPNDLSEGQQEALKALVASKATLLKHSIRAEELPLEFTEDKITFPWFPVPENGDETTAYMQLAAALVKMAKTQKRITAKDHEVPNEKYAMRCFLLRLGFIGNEYKTSRKFLLRNLTGNSSWRNGAPEKRQSDETDQ